MRNHSKHTHTEGGTCNPVVHFQRQGISRGGCFKEALVMLHHVHGRAPGMMRHWRVPRAGVEMCGFQSLAWRGWGAVRGSKPACEGITLQGQERAGLSLRTAQLGAKWAHSGHECAEGANEGNEGGSSLLLWKREGGEASNTTRACKGWQLGIPSLKDGGCTNGELWCPTEWLKGWSLWREGGDSEVSVSIHAEPGCLWQEGRQLQH